MIDHQQLAPHALRADIRSGNYTLAGNARLRTYGLLSCRSGKRLKKKNRVFFHDEAEAMRLGFRPCGHCLPHRYRQWKVSKKQVEDGLSMDDL